MINKNSHSLLSIAFIALIIFVSELNATAQSKTGGKKISPDLLSLFFEDINYSADGGLYAGLMQNLKGRILAEQTPSTSSDDWKKYEASLIPAENTFKDPENVVSLIAGFSACQRFNYSIPPMSVTVIRVKQKKQRIIFSN